MIKGKNENLHKAKAAKNDEFYTRLEDIEKELKHYTEHFKGKVVYCNCDDARESNFFKYFSTNFQKLGLKKLITSGLKIDGTEDGTDDGTGVIAIQKGDDIDIYDGNGDFRSEECIEFLKEADIVVTNPPFSLFREYVAQLMQYGKKFLIIGSQNAVTYKEIFPLLKDNKMWWGTDCVRWFIVSEKLNKITKISYKGETIAEGDRSRWFTNIPHNSRNIELDLYKKYSADEYPKYDNYDAIEVSRTENIPMDYDGVMGVPITFLDKYCPTQFEIIDINPHFYTLVEQGLPKPKQLSLANYGKKDPYARLLIQKIN